MPSLTTSERITKSLGDRMNLECRDLQRSRTRHLPDLFGLEDMVVVTADIRSYPHAPIDLSRSVRE